MLVLSSVAAGFLVGTLAPIPVVLPVVPAMAAPAPCETGPNAPVLVGGVYQVSTAAQMVHIRERSTCLDKSFVLTDNIDLGTNGSTTSAMWKPIELFTGSFNGAGKTISGLFATRDTTTSAGVGLFNTGIGATFSNLTVLVDGFDIMATGTTFGGLIGKTDGPVTINAVTVSSSTPIQVSGQIGGLIGLAEWGDTLIEDSVADVDLSSSGSSVGGLVGGRLLSPIVINRGSATGSLSGLDKVGGLIGFAFNDPVTISASRFSGTVAADGNHAGGLVGQAFGPVTITASHVASDVTAVTAKAGGFVGEASGVVTVTNSTFSGDVGVTSTSGEYAGGLVGAADGLTSISGSRVSGHVSAARSYVGGHLGFVGSGNVQIANSEFDGSVSGRFLVGGMIGTVDYQGGAVSINNATVSATVTGQSNHVGGMVGAAEELTVVGSSFRGGVSISPPTTSARLGGLAGFATNATISATTVVADFDQPQTDKVGGFIGEVYGQVTVSASTYTGDIRAVQKAGGLIGSAGGVSITGSEASGAIEGGPYLGGLVGIVDMSLGNQTVIATSSFDGSLDGSSQVGGLVGSALNGPSTITGSIVESNIDATGSGAGGLIGSSATIGNFPLYTVAVSNSSFTGDASGTFFVGGLVGFVSGLFHSQSNRAQGTIIADSGGPGSGSGGLVGRAGQVSVSASAFTGTVSGQWMTGGLVGALVPWPELTEDSTISESYARATVQGTDTAQEFWYGAGGLIGYLRSTTTSAVAINHSFFNGSVSGSRISGGLLGSSVPILTDFPPGSQFSAVRITKSYAVGSFSGPAMATISAFVGLEATVSAITNSFCIDALLCPINNTTTSATLKSQSAMEAVGWNFNTTWCFSPGKNDDYPLLRNVTSGPPSNTPCWVYIPPPPVPPTQSSPPPAGGPSPVRSSLDPGGGSCRVGGVNYSGVWNTTSLGFGYLPGPSDCARSGYQFKGWARSSAPTVVIDLPLIVDPSDGVARYFSADSGDLVAVWVADSTAGTPTTPVVPNDPVSLRPAAFVAFGNFFCTRCTSLWLVWPAPDAAMGVKETVSDSAGRRICSVGIESIGDWHVCFIKGLTPGRKYTYTLRFEQGTTTGPSVTTSISLRRR